MNALRNYLYTQTITVSALLQRLLDLCHWNRAFPDDLPRSAMDLHDSRSQRRASFSAVQNQRHPPAELFHQLLRVRT